MDRIPAPAAAPPPGRADWRAAALSIVGFWLFYFVLTSTQMAIKGSPDQLDAAMRRAVMTLFGMVLTALLYLLFRRLEGASTRVLVGVAFAASAPLALAYSAVNYAAFYVISPSDTLLADIAATPRAWRRSPAIMIVDGALSRYFLIVTWAVLWLALSYAAKVGDAERRAGAYRAQAQAAQLRALRFQINPHFLFNTLNSLSSLVMHGRGAAAEQMIMNLSTFFRTSLTADPCEDVPLADELEMQRLYLEVEQVRFPERLVFDIDVPPALDRARVPGLILQPLVENAIKYGVSRSIRPVTVSVWAQAEGGRLHLVVEDDGDPVDAAPPGHGVGLKNVCDRIDTRFGAAGYCRAGPRDEGGYRVELGIPLRCDD